MANIVAGSTYRVYFGGKVIETTVADKGCVVDAWVSNIRSIYNGQQIIVGLDTEWRPNVTSTMNNKTALLQLCIDTKCLLVQLFHIDYIPLSLSNLLQDPNVTYVGVEVDKDAARLMDDYGLYCVRTVDVRELAKQRWPDMLNANPGLQDIAFLAAGIFVPKPEDVRRSDWQARVLISRQIEYACIDAYASYRVGLKLLYDI